MDGVYGFVCVHGVFVMGHFIPGSMTYLHAILQVCTNNYSISVG